MYVFTVYMICNLVNVPILMTSDVDRAFTIADGIEAYYESDGWKVNMQHHTLVKTSLAEMGINQVGYTGVAVATFDRGILTEWREY